MSARPLLRVLTNDGEVLETSSVEEENAALRSALTRAEKSNTALRAMLADERKKARTTHPIDDAFEDWQAKVVEAGMKGKARCKLSDDRIDALAKMFTAGYTLEDFLLVNSGIAAFRFVVYGKRRQSGCESDVNVELVYVCKEAWRFEEAAKLGYLAEKAREAQA